MTDVKPLEKKKLSAEGEPLRRYHEARALLKRVTTAWGREGHEEGETISESMDAAGSWIGREELEEELFPDETRVLQRDPVSGLPTVIETDADFNAG